MHTLYLLFHTVLACILTGIGASVLLLVLFLRDHADAKRHRPPKSPPPPDSKDPQ